jgi:acylglycerol lipase
MTMERIEQTIAGAGGLELFTWRLELERPLGAAVILHGYGEHSARHAEVAELLAGLGLSCYLLDLRGHGRSGGPRGAITRWGDYLDDLDIFVEQVTAWHGAPPSLLLGHSLGGLLATSYVLERQTPFEMLVLSSPLLAVGDGVSQVKQALGKVIARFFPKVSLPTEIDPGHLSRDPAVGQAYLADPLVHRVVNTRWFAEAMAAMARCQENAGELPVKSFLVLYGAQDPLVSPRGTEEFCAQVQLADAACLPYEGFYHEVFKEVGKERVLEDLNAWLTERL